YSFPELRYLENDFYTMNYYTTCHPASFQIYIAPVISFLRKENEIYCKVVLVNDEVNVGGRTQPVKVYQTEDTVHEFCAITLTEEENGG
ncbi:hypothetical protein NEOLEDRAFT_1038023, partial [Neolentinus lepideus HHB14362 ss-1]